MNNCFTYFLFIEGKTLLSEKILPPTLGRWQHRELKSKLNDNLFIDESN